MDVARPSPRLGAKQATGVLLPFDFVDHQTVVKILMTITLLVVMIIVLHAVLQTVASLAANRGALQTVVGHAASQSAVRHNRIVVLQ